MLLGSQYRYRQCKLVLEGHLHKAHLLSDVFAE